MTRRKDCIGVAVDVATQLMRIKGITPKFTLADLRDSISQYNCGLRGQSRKFHKLDQSLLWTGTTVQLKVPVIHLLAFPEDARIALARSN